MNEKRTEADSGILASNVEASRGKEANVPNGRSPTRDERLGLIREFQNRALQQTDPLTANLELISGDLMLFAYKIRESMAKDLTDEAVTAEACRRFEQKAETYLKFVRQIDRLAFVQRQMSRAEE